LHRLLLAGLSGSLRKTLDATAVVGSVQNLSHI
jgi:hypothetical protein